MVIRARIQDPNIYRIFGATFALGLAYGMAISLFAVFLDQRGFGKDAIGSLAAWFASGVVLLSLPMGNLIERFTAKRTLVAALAGYAVTVSLFPFLESYWAIAAVRVLDGAFSVGVWVSSETILLSRAGTKNKAYVTSLYAIMVATGYLFGPLTARGLAMVAPYSLVFVVAGLIAFGASTFVALTVDRELPTEAEQSDDIPAAARPTTIRLEGSIRSILWRIKNSCYATFAYGYFQASVVLFLPLYLIEHKGVTADQTILIPAYFAAGMLLFSNIGGRIGDRRGHLAVMRLLAAVGVTTILAFVYLDSFLLMAIAVSLGGATLATISPLSLALQGVVVSRVEYPRANSLYNAFYAAGMLLGPPISSALFIHYGGAMMLYHLAALWSGFVLFSIVFYRDDPAVMGPTLLPGESSSRATAE